MSTASNIPKATNRRRRNGSQHDKTGCLTCRYRRKKCMQNTFPVCGTCARLHLECIREPPRNVVPPAFVAGEQQTAARPPSPQPSSSPSPLSLSSPSSRPLFSSSRALPSLSHWKATATAAPQEAKSWTSSVQHRYAMRYYVNELASHFSISPQFNSFLSDFLPLAMQSQALQESLLSLASSHISLVDPTYEVAALEARARAIVHLKSAIALPHRDVTWSQEHSATCLVFAMGLITTTSDSQGWYDHMQGAKHFILGAQGSGSDGRPLGGIDCLKQSAEGRWVLRNFAYHDVLGCVTLRSQPLIAPSYIDDEICSEMDSYMGIGTSLLRHIAEVQILAVDMSQLPAENRSAFPRDFEQKWNRMEKDLQDWVCPEPVVEKSDSLTSIALAYRSVALILLYRLVRQQARIVLDARQDKQQQRHAMQAHEQDSQNHQGPLFTTQTLIELLQSKISFQVSETIRHVSAIPVWSAPEAAILFPLFVAGGEAHDERQADVIRTRLGQNLARRRFQNIGRALEILEVLWGRKKTEKENMGIGGSVNPSCRPADWQDILDEMDWELVLT